MMLVSALEEVLDEADALPVACVELFEFVVFSDDF